MLALGLTLLVAIEIGARLFGFGYSTRLFHERTVNDAPVLTVNHHFFRSFFPSSISRSPQPVLTAYRQPPKVRRILWLGESAALGDPEPDLGPARILEHLLIGRFPEQSFEVLNLAVTAVNSHVILSLAQELTSFDSDFWCLYLGNNEVHGPFGPGTAFGSAQSRYPLIRASIAARKTRIGQFFAALRERTAASAGAEWGGMAMFAERHVTVRDPRLQGVYRHFETNLNGIVEAGLKSGAKVLLGTVAVNLRSSSPFVSISDSWDRSVARSEQAARLDQIRQLLDAGLHDEALATVGETLEEAPDFAELHFLAGRCHWLRQDYPAASASFRQARDLDALRFRADGRLNDLVKQAGTGFAETGGVALVDSEALFAFNAPHNIPGDELFWDHVHFRFPGAYLLALAFAMEIENQFADSEPKDNRPPWPSLEDCARALSLTSWDDFRMTRTMRGRLAQAPFNSQSVHDARDQRLVRELNAHATGNDPAAFPVFQQIFERALAEDSNDYFLRDRYARMLADFGRNEEAVAQWKLTVADMPWHLSAHFRIGQILAKVPERAEEAEDHLRQALQIRPETADLLLALGEALINQQSPRASLRPLRKALKFRPNSVRALLLNARAHLELNEREEALRLTELAAEQAPEDPAVQSALNSIKADP